ncbi:hypothetical protein B0181_10210 [Moraxella caviae]|uniref:Uncharacterized protein n=1 Tax=Moraxella caviae TaxID=34060 RepID=A0A1S9ZX47_9GAMM|nr:hypothetical protein [Moraxella caviae]OOR87521.1 hypothetical protein B0181_10210 [Moraxella caviae]STZ14960.1 Uncharacterised protein [Moraxella caviae]
MNFFIKLFNKLFNRQPKPVPINPIYEKIAEKAFDIQGHAVIFVYDSSDVITSTIECSDNVKNLLVEWGFGNAVVYSHFVDAYFQDWKIQEITLQPIMAKLFSPNERLSDIKIFIGKSSEEVRRAEKVVCELVNNDKIEFFDGLHTGELAPFWLDQEQRKVFERYKREYIIQHARNSIGYCTISGFEHE